MRQEIGLLPGSGELGAGGAGNDSRARDRAQPRPGGHGCWVLPVRGAEAGFGDCWESGGGIMQTAHQESWILSLTWHGHESTLQPWKSYVAP